MDDTNRAWALRWKRAAHVQRSMHVERHRHYVAAVRYANRLAARLALCEAERRQAEARVVALRAEGERLRAVAEAAQRWDKADGTMDFPAAEEELIAAVRALEA